MSDTKQKLWRKVRRFVPILRFVPGVRMVAVCNNLAFSEVSDDSDIDLFIVVHRGYLFSARLLVTALFQLLGVRRHGRKVAGRFCLSFFVDDSALDFSGIAIERDFYLARWIANLKPVIDDGVSEEFWKENSWVNDFFAKGFEGDLSFVVGEPVGVMRFLIPGFAERLLKRWQIGRALKKKAVVKDDAGLVVGEHMLKFHNIDRRQYYRDLWLKEYGEDFTLDLL